MESNKCILCEYYGSHGYHCEVVAEAKFNINQMDKRWEELFHMPMAHDSESSWEMTECEVEPLFEISVKDNVWWWQIGRRLWFNEHYKLIYAENGSAENFVEALELALDAFEKMDPIIPMTELSDIDDEFT